MKTTFELYLPEFANETDENEEKNQDENIIRNKAGNAVLTTISPLASDEKPVLGMNISEFDSRRSFALNPENTHILFVDDEDAVRSVGARGLKRKGFAVTDCISAENALEHLDNGVSAMRFPCVWYPHSSVHMLWAGHTTMSHMLVL